VSVCVSVMCSSNSAKFSDLKRESENKKYRNLLPRERMRIEKQQKADENIRILQYESPLLYILIFTLILIL